MTHDLDQALALLSAGELVGIPTETVYGLAADAAQPLAVAKIFAAKGRPNDHPVIVHIAGKEQLSDWATDIPEAAWQLCDAFWPGPLTLILKKQAQVSHAVTGGQDTVGLRAPAHPITHELLKRFGGGLAAPSANQFGHVSPTTAQHVRDEFSPEVLSLILDGGACDVGVESTIVSLVGPKPVLLRPGGVPRAAIEAVLGQTIEHQKSTSTANIRVSGLLDSHYAPRTTLLTGTQAQIEAEAIRRSGQKLAIVHTLALTQNISAQSVVMPDNANDYAQVIYATLRDLDQQGLDAILLVLPQGEAAWLAVHDRLGRAAHQKLGD
ncbi:L-threonylcarbamoyladenylate synthase [Iodobacter sp. CM08]|uniref:L-threonylcarbamoyladenylate synthase n=1 Tax=Iodobacter sp. CM08 TaxID=3085902 RepID=UPI002980CD96|nr:L-threonylcarbamoyladenylate synthase [Iodobacter sp. CM08]MDW5417244.1 L-threonylcarbamoyladenylate synthase [Iodobacter sp. CM08]